MSWSVQRAGKVEAVRVAVAADFTKITYLSGAELAAKDATAAAVDKALEGFVGAAGVQVNASGSQVSSGTVSVVGSQTSTGTGAPSYIQQQSLRVEVTPLWNYVE